jgi:hypothetical protein
MAAHLGTVFGLSPYCLLPACFTAVSGALGKAARLVSPASPGPLTAALHVALCDNDCRLSEAVDFILQPLRELQSDRFREESESNCKWIRERIAHLEGFHEQWAAEIVEDSASDSRPAQIAALRLRLKPLMLLENPAPGELVQAMPRCADASLLVTYDDASFGRLLDAATKSAAGDFRLLHHGWIGRTLEAPGMDGACPTPVIQPSISCLIVCRTETLGRLLRLKEPAVEQFRRQLVTIKACEESRETLVQPGQSVELSKRWHKLISSLVGRRRSGADYRAGLHADAECLALKHWQQDHHQRSASTPQPSAPILAAKFALCSQVASQAFSEVSGPEMENAISVAQWCSEYTTGLNEMLTASAQRAELERAAEKMLTRLQKHGPITPRDLFRTYDNQRKELHQPALDHLISRGKARFINGVVQLATLQVKSTAESNYFESRNGHPKPPSKCR